jgi:phosphoglycolate phosphatase-like HAD superfamily hydrolase
MLLIGDALTDSRAAAAAGAAFVGRVPEGQPDIFEAERRLVVVKDLNELLRVWEGLFR